MNWLIVSDKKSLLHKLTTFFNHSQSATLISRERSRVVNEPIHS